MKLKDIVVERGEESIVFNAALLAQALTYHLRDSNLPEKPMLADVSSSAVSAEIPRKTWASMDDGQRLDWLLEVTHSHTDKAPQRMEIE